MKMLLRIRANIFIFVTALYVVLGGILLNSMGVYASGCTQTVTNTNDSGAGSFRQAILNSNGASGNTICFSIGSGQQTIMPASALPPITQSVIIDGTTQTGFDSSTNVPIIVLDGRNAGSTSFGLRITGSGAGSTVKGLVIDNFGSDGMFIDTNNVTVQDNYVGIDPSGINAAGNGADGIGIFSGTSAASASGNTIGGTTSATRNVIAGNKGNGVAITSQNGGTASNNIMEGNYVGTNAEGTSVISNHGDGVLINNAVGSGNSTGDIIGGTTGNSPGAACTGACNLLAGNTANGAGLWHAGVSSDTVEGNYIGTNVSGTGSLANGNIGVEMADSPNDTIGGTTPAARNIISGNLGAGVFLDGGDSTGDNVIGNYIGSDVSGSYSIANAKMGISIGYSYTDPLPATYDNIGGSTGTTPGGACAGECNLISGNAQDGLFLITTQDNQVKGNYIGTNAAGTGNLKNGIDGIGLLNSQNNTIGGGSTSEANVVSSNSGNGIIVAGSGSTGNRVVGNNIGIASNGGSLGNAGAGVYLAAGIDTAILQNNINFNVNSGIYLDSGANESQAFPNVYAAHTVGSTTKIGGELHSTPNSKFQLDFFASNNCNGGPPNNYGQGEQYVGSITVSTDTFGNSSFGYSPGSAVAGGKYITATASKEINSIPAETSSLSKCRLVNTVKPALTNGATWFLKDYLTTGPADKTFSYGFPAYLLMCAWDPSQPGVKLPVVFSGGTWYMRASYTTGDADLTFSYGPSNGKPVCGDWNGDGVDTVGIVGTDNTWYLRNSNNAGAADISFQFGSTGTIPVVGDWTGSGTDTIGTYNQSTGLWNLRNSNSAGPPDESFSYGYTPGYPVVGDWTGSGTDTIGSVSPGGTWALRTSNSSGAPDITFQYGFPGTIPMTW